MIRLIWVMIALGGLLLVFSAGYVGYALGDYDGYRGGYQEGYKVGCIAEAGSGYTLRNLTYSELRDFLEQDRTNENEYQEGVYTCGYLVSNWIAMRRTKGFALHIS